MNWANIWLIWQREVRDQLRDRRTLFMIFVLPILLYPFMGMLFLQLIQFSQEHPTTVRVYGREHLPEQPPLLFDGQFHANWFPRPEDARLLKLEWGILPQDAAEGEASPAAMLREIQRQVEPELRDGSIHAAVVFPPGFGRQLEEFRAKLAAGEKPSRAAVPQPTIFHISGKKLSDLTKNRLHAVLGQWRQEIIAGNRSAANIPDSTPFELDPHDLADERLKHAAVWAMIFPLLMLIWSLTGAFYPAVDLCAGEKERGTLETLLVGPAERGEIVCGKLLTIMLFSLATVALNLASVAGSGWFFISRFEKAIPGLGPPPAMALLWLVLAAVPVSAMFSALCLALAAFARSTKEGQYYLMPLFLVTMPLVLLPVQPSFELNLGTSLIPVTGVVLLLRAMIEGDYWEGLRYFVPVSIVTGLCCFFSIRWAIDQFNKESVLFREGERLDLRLRLLHMVRDREDTPSPAAAFVCVGLIMALKFAISLAAAGKTIDMMQATLVLMIAAILAPALLMTVMLTRNFRATLSLRWPGWKPLAAVTVLALAWHPLASLFAGLVNRLYPLSDEVRSQVAGMFSHEPGWSAFFIHLGVIALAPAICEELAFRGFVLSGFRRLGRKHTAILLSAFFFGVTHSILQQSIVAGISGVVIGYVVVQSGSIFVGMLFHFINNGLFVCLMHLRSEVEALHAGPAGHWIWDSISEESLNYSWLVVAIATALTIETLRYFHNLPYQPTGEEALRHAIEKNTARHVPATYAE